MPERSPEKVIVNDVGPRDGLQNQAKILPPAERIQLVEALLSSGMTHVEVGAFVSPKAIQCWSKLHDYSARYSYARSSDYTDPM